MRSSAIFIPGVNHAREGLSGGVRSAHSSGELSHTTTKPPREGSPESDEESVCTEGESLTINDVLIIICCDIYLYL